MIRVLLAGDQALVRGALAAVLRLEPDIDVVAEIGTGTEVLAAAQRTTPDIALLDAQMPGRDGLTVAPTSNGRCPAAAPSSARPSADPATSGGRCPRPRPDTS
ncbi:response regulator transcription factor [Streptomyces noursei]